MSANIDLLGDAHLSDAFEEIALDYGDSGGEENTRLSCDDVDLWDSMTETPSMPDTSKFIYLFANELKVINDLEFETPREITGCAILCFTFVKTCIFYDSNIPLFNVTDSSSVRLQDIMIELETELAASFAQLLRQVSRTFIDTSLCYYVLHPDFHLQV